MDREVMIGFPRKELPCKSTILNNLDGPKGEYGVDVRN